MEDKQYKELSCKDFRGDCDFTVRAETEGEILMKCRDHACDVHGKCWNTSETDARIKRRMRDVRV
jgi:predicted small metal-binding protein